MDPEFQHKKVLYKIGKFEAQFEMSFRSWKLKLLSSFGLVASNFQNVFLIFANYWNNFSTEKEKQLFPTLCEPKVISQFAGPYPVRGIFLLVLDFDPQIHGQVFETFIFTITFASTAEFQKVSMNNLVFLNDFINMSIFSDSKTLTHQK